MYYYDKLRNNERRSANESPKGSEAGVQDKILEKMYTTTAGRIALKPLTCKAVSNVVGKFLNQKKSLLAVPVFMQLYQFDPSEFEKKAEEFTCYNDFFTRKLKAEVRPVDMEESHLISPCDSKLTVYPITDDLHVTVKNTDYTVSQLLRDEKLASKYAGGSFCLFRLTVDDYHRYCYVSDGIKTSNRKIPGVYHTVNPIANDLYPIYKENSREYSLLRTKDMGDILQMQVGALMVGKIVNLDEKAKVCRGQEMGYFEFGGSTVILMFEAGKILLDEDILINSENGYETKVRFGEKIGTICK